jgi:Tol biopolymer transport system component
MLGDMAGAGSPHRERQRAAITAVSILLIALGAGLAGLPRGQQADAALRRGSLIAYTSLLGDGSRFESLVVASAKGRIMRRITTPRIDGEAISPDFSPNGRLLVYAAMPKGVNCCHDLYVEGIARNASRRRLTRTPGLDELSPTWGPNGRIAFVTYNNANWRSGNRLEVMSSRGGNRRTVIDAKDLAGDHFDHSVAFGGWQEMAAALSPDGRQIAFYAISPAPGSTFDDPILNEGIHLIDADGSDLRFIAPINGLHEGAWDIDFSPNGRTIGWIPSPDWEFGEDPEHVFLVETDGTKRRDLTGRFGGSGYANAFTFSPKGQRVAVRGGYRDYKVNLFDLKRLPLVLKGRIGRQDYGGQLDWALLNPR